MLILIDRGGRVALAIHRCRKPTIAAIQGPAVGVSPPLCFIICFGYPKVARIIRSTERQAPSLPYLLIFDFVISFPTELSRTIETLDNEQNAASNSLRSLLDIPITRSL